VKSYDAVVVGSGPNGLAAGITLAQAGRSVVIFEAAANIGGGARSEFLTEPGFIHDVCSAVHPLAVTSPFFRSLNLEKFGLQWIDSPAALAHPLDHGESVSLYTSLEKTAENLAEDADRYMTLMEPLVKHWEELFADILQPILHWPKHPFLLARFGLPSLLSAQSLAKKYFLGPRARALFGGLAAHSIAPLNHSGTSAIGLMLCLAAHAKGWPIPRGGSQKISDALVAYFRSLGGEIVTQNEIHSVDQLPPSQMVFFDLTPRPLARILSGRLPSRLQKKMSTYLQGPGVFKMDWALSEPIPWSSPACAQAATLHLGGSFDEIAAAESAPAMDRCAEKPYVLLCQPSLFDSSRAPSGHHTAWAYCHVPPASTVNCREAIENQIERYAPGFKRRIIACSALSATDMEKKNANLVGGDISGGAFSLERLFFRPFAQLNSYRLPIPGYYICSSSTPPGPGVHGMCGFNAVRAALEL
jgi:phytoene dehydrogenase-like protein